MTKSSSLIVLALAALLGTSSAANAQLSRQDPATGERYNVEISYGWWDPTPDIQVSSESLGIPGTVIDFVEDFGYEKKRLREFRAVLRPARKHKFRIEYLPIGYEIEGAILSRPITFNGQTFRVGIPVNTDTTWKTWRFGYEYDFVYRDRGYVGMLLEARYTKASIELDSPITTEFADATAPIPAVGVVARGYPLRNVAFTGEFSIFRLLNREEDNYKAHYYDFDVYGTLNFTNNVGVSGGYRSLDVSYTVDADFGQVKLKGYYLVGVVRF